MAAPLLAPAIGGERKPGVVVQWYRDDGTEVAAGEPVLCFESEYVTVDVEAEEPGRLHRCFPPGTQAMPGNVVALILAPGEPVPEHVEDPMAEPPALREGVEADAPASEPREPIMLPLRRGALKPPPSPPAGGAWDRAFGTSGHDYRGFWPLRDEIPQGEEQGGDGPPLAVAPEEHRAEGEELTYAQYLAEAEDDGAQVSAPVIPDEPEAGNDAGDVVVPWRPGYGPGHHAHEEVERDVPVTVPEVWEEPAAVYAVVAPAALRGTVRLTELRKLSDQLGREWRDSAPAPRNEDLVLRAAARAILESEVLAEIGDSAGLVVPGRNEDILKVLPGAARGSLRERVAMLATAGEAGAETPCSFTVTTFATYGVDDAIPVIPEGHVLAFAMGATRPGSTMEDGIPAPVMTLTLAYLPDRITQGEAATLFARVRELVEAPYALLAD